VTVGEHRGANVYTIGQRHGLGIGGSRRYQDGTPWYVYDKDVASNTVYVVQGHDHPLLLSKALDAIDVNWISGAPPAETFRASAKTRYRQVDEPCSVTITEENGIHVAFDTPQRAVACGQSVVLYQDEVCLGGGVIDAAQAVSHTPAQRL